MKTRQDLFTNAWQVLSARGWTRAGEYEPSLYTANELIWYCRYRSSIGPCAIGASISNDRDIDRLEGLGACDKPICDAMDFDFQDKDFALQLQNCHDDNEKPEDMERSFREFAKSYALTIPEAPANA